MLYRGKLKVAEVLDDGGIKGLDFKWLVDGEEKRFADYAAMLSYDFMGKRFCHNPGTLVGIELEQKLARMLIGRKCRHCTVVKLKDDAAGEVTVIDEP